MNLHQIVSGAIGAINPPTLCKLQSSTGFVMEGVTQVPQYACFDVMCQIQPLSSGDLRKLDALNIQGVNKAIYINGNVEGVNRVAIKGGDLFTFPDGTAWLVVVALENWPDWSKIAVVKQDVR